LIRGIKQQIHGLLHRKKKRKKLAQEPDQVPISWIRKQKAAPDGKPSLVIKHKKRIPGLLYFKRALASVLLFLNFVMSQFLLGTLGAAAQPLFIFFLANSFILLDYLWKTRRKEQ
jgi:hypothetical protein